MLNESEFQNLILLWVIAGGVLFIGQWKLGQGTGLVPAFVLELFVLHWLAAVIYLLPWYSNLSPAIVYDGLQQSTIALVAFSIGALASTIWAYMRYGQAPRDPEEVVFADTYRVRAYLLMGSIAYVVLMPMLGNIPTVSAIVSAASSLVIVGLVLGCWNAARAPSPVALVGWLLVVAALPMITIAAQGFLGYGLAAAAVVFMFVASFYRATFRKAISTVLVTYFCLSLYVTYMRDRKDIREVVWRGSSVSARLVQLEGTFTEFEPFNIYDVDHLYRIDVRLNQNYLVGAAVRWLDVNREQFAGGETLADAVLALVPRALWPDKPFSAGSGDLVSRFTGIRFAEGTSVGVGPVLELYVNFGSTGVFVGFVCIGFLLSAIDRRAAVYRNAGDWTRFVYWFLPGVAMLQVGGSVIEVTTSAAAAIVVGMTAGTLVRPPGERVREPLEEVEAAG